MTRFTRRLRERDCHLRVVADAVRDCVPLQCGRMHGSKRRPAKERREATRNCAYPHARPKSNCLSQNGYGCIYFGKNLKTLQMFRGLSSWARLALSAARQRAADHPLGGGALPEARRDGPPVVPPHPAPRRDPAVRRVREAPHRRSPLRAPTEAHGAGGTIARTAQRKRR